ncbi:MAG: hypothetical protein U1F04_05760 [Burkholderiaceae bacterium]
MHTAIQICDFTAFKELPKKCLLTYLRSLWTISEEQSTLPTPLVDRDRQADNQTIGQEHQLQTADGVIAHLRNGAG